jgi:phage shock protein A
MGDDSKLAAFDRLKHKVIQGQAVSEAYVELAGDNLEERLRKLDREERINQMLADLKARRSVS